MSRLVLPLVAASLLLLACGGAEPELLGPGPEQPGGGLVDPDPTTPDDAADVPLSDEELEYGTEGDEAITEEEIEEGRRSTQGFTSPAFTAAAASAAAAAHPNVDREGEIPPNLKSAALTYFEANKQQLRNTRYLAIVDMAQHSGKERMFIVNLSTGAVTKSVVAHGSGSDPSHSGTPTRFSNTSGSNMTSLGFYKTAETYQSTRGFGRGLRLDGLSATNSNARARGVVMHGASYVSRGRAKQGRSSGCPAVPMADRDNFFSMLQGGALLVIDRGVVAEDGCAGKADGYYCSTISPNSAYDCRSEARAGVTQCSDATKRCKAGAGGAATLGGGSLTCE